MNKETIAALISPLVVFPLSCIGVWMVGGSFPSTLHDYFFIAGISLPVGYFGLLLIVLPSKWLLNKYNSLNLNRLVAVGGVFGGILFSVLDYGVPGHASKPFLAYAAVFVMGSVLGLAVTLSYAVMSGITNRST